MNKFVLISIMAFFSFFSFAHASSLTEVQKTQAIQKMAKIAKFTPDEEVEHFNFLTNSSDADVKAYLVKMIFDYEKTIDNPNAIDLMDIQTSLERKSLVELINRMDY